MTMSNFYSYEELRELGFRHLGSDVLISRKTSIFKPERIQIGNHVRIDDYCLLSGVITLGNYIHIAAYSAFFGGESSIEMENFSGLAYRSTIVAESDDYSGEYMTNPTIPINLRKVSYGKVHIGKHVVLGTGSIILPNVTIGDGCSFGAMSLINRDTEPWGVYAGVPVKRLRERSKELLQFEERIGDYE